MKTMKKLTFAVMILALSILVGSTAVQANDKAPNKLIQERINRVLTILHDSKRGDSEQKLHEKLRKTLEPVIDFNEMTRRSLGAHGRKLTDGQIEDLTQAFKKLLEQVYIGRFTSHLSDTGPDSLKLEDIEVKGQEKKGSYARVFSDVIFRRNNTRSNISLNYRMVNRGNGWHIYDLEIEGVSLVSNYRSQFSNTLTNHSFEYLLNALEKKSEKAQEKPIDDGTIPEI